MNLICFWSDHSRLPRTTPAKCFQGIVVQMCVNIFSVGVSLLHGTVKILTVRIWDPLFHSHVLLKDLICHHFYIIDSSGVCYCCLVMKVSNSVLPWCFLGDIFAFVYSLITGRLPKGQLLLLFLLTSWGAIFSVFLPLVAKLFTGPKNRLGLVWYSRV